MTARYFDDFQVGERFVTGGVTVTEALIVDFALVYDPQPFHIDAAAAKDTHFGGLIASGFQTLGLAWRLFHQENVVSAASLGSPGIDRLRWHRPVRPGDTIRTSVEVREVRPSDSKPDRGYLTLAFEVFNQDAELVMSFACTLILRRGPATV